MHLSVLQFGKFLLFPLNFGSLAVKTMAFFEIPSLFIVKSSVDHTSYKYCVLCMVKHKYFPISWLIGNKSSGNCRNFIIFILRIVSMCSHIQIVHIVWLIGIKAMAIIEISSFSPASYIASCVTYIQIQKPILPPHWFGSLAVNAREIIEISIISHQLSAV